MRSDFRCFFAAFMLAVLASVSTSPSFAQSGESRFALVIGNAQYRSAPLATPANDAGLLAQTLQAAGFDVTGAADLDQASLRQTFRDFVDKVRNAGPDAVVFVYLAGRGVQYAGDNYIVPVDAVIQRDSDVPVEALRLADYTQALAGLALKARIYVFDLARPNTYAKSGTPLASGLSLLDAESGSLYAFNAAPGTVAPDEQGPYSAYAQALVEMMHQGYSVNDVFAQTRLRVNQLTAGAVVPWDVTKIDAPIFFFQRDASAPPLPNAADLERPLHDYPVQDAYAIALDRDTFAAYQEFILAFPDDPLARRVRALLAARREALTWRRALDANSPAAYWSYMRRYPHGPHFFDARRRLIILSAALDPPPRFDPYGFDDLAPPPEAEYEIVDRPEVVFYFPDYPPPPPPPAFVVLQRPAEFTHLAPPPAHERGVLPIPAPVPVPFSHPAARAPGVINQPRIGQQLPENRKPPAGVPPRAHELPVPGQQPVQVPAQQPPAPHVAPEHEHEREMPHPAPPPPATHVAPPPATHVAPPPATHVAPPSAHVAPPPHPEQKPPVKKEEPKRD